MPIPDGRGERAVPDRAPPLDMDATVAGEIPFRPLSISEMLDGAIACVRLFPRAVLGPSLAITAVIQVAGSIAAYYFVGRTARAEVSPDWIVRSVGTQFALGAFGLVLSAFGIVVLAGMLGPVLGRALMGSRATLRSTWRDTRPRLWRLIGIALIVTLLPLAAMIVPVVPFALFLAVEADPVAILLAAVIGFPVGAVLMIWLYVLLVLAAPALVLERETAGGALERAWTLSKGRWWRTCGTLLLAILVTVFMGFFALRIPFLLIQLLFFGSGGDQSTTILALTVDTVGRIVSWTVVLPFDAGVIALLYIDRRMRREGFDLELRARVHESAAAPRAAGNGQAAAEDGEQDGEQDGREPGDDFVAHWRVRPSLQPGATRGTP
ncbi:hypothetical protein [Actinomadura sp. SCN-SB]|uniref:hypothetical protein n=1 Tax=Actinomadura sp. SCN-SB TaxID=3373092 RepID=UPI003753200F